MDLDEALSWPSDFEELRRAPPPGVIVFTTVLDPVLRISRSGEGYAVNLGARLVRRTGVQLLVAPALDSTWVHGAGLVHPLPRGTNDLVSSFLRGMDPKSLSYKDVIRLQQLAKDDMDVVLDEDVLVTANEAAEAESEGLVVHGLEAELYPYQVKGVSWMRKALSRTGGVVLADEMGLGKTLQIISLLLLDPPEVMSPALVICPTTLIANWVRELNRFSPSLTVMVHRGSDRGTLPRHLLGAHVVITTYDTLVNDLVLFKAVNWSWLICDEAQALKNPESQRRSCVSQVPRTRTIPVTGTPVETRLLDLWSLVDLAIPGLLGKREEFEALYPDCEESARALASLTSPIVLKRRVSDVAGDLPERTDVLVPLELGATLAQEYEEVRQATLERFPKAGSLVATGQLQIFCAHPSLVSVESWLLQDDPEPSAGVDRLGQLSVTPKLQRTVELLEEAFANNRKVLIFSNFNACGPMIKCATGASETTFWGFINGGTPQEERQAIVDAFSAHPDNAVLILNPRAAGAGLNITAATVVIHYTQVWNPALEAQASARAHRRGQKNPVTIYHLYYVDTVEQVMLERSQMRRELGSEAVYVQVDDAADVARALAITPVQK
jgi:SNF2 family DNA or RNA helicase